VRFRPPQIVAHAGMGRQVNDLVTDINRVLARIPQDSGVKAARVSITYPTLTATFPAIPANAKIMAFTIDNVVPWSAGTTAVLRVGSAAGGAQYITGDNIKVTTGKINATHTAAQMASMDNVRNNQSVHCTVVTTGSHSQGETHITMWYQ